MEYYLLLKCSRAQPPGADICTGAGISLTHHEATHRDARPRNEASKGIAKPALECAVVNRTSARSAHARLELRREQLIKRLEALRPATKANRGYRSAKELLGSRYIRASMAARVTLIEAADFLVRVLEMMPLV